MPLFDGSSDDVLRANIAELRRSGYPEAQAVTIAHKKAAQGLAGAAAAAKKQREQLAKEHPDDVTPEEPKAKTTYTDKDVAKAKPAAPKAQPAVRIDPKTGKKYDPTGREIK